MSLFSKEVASLSFNSACVSCLGEEINGLVALSEKLRSPALNQDSGRRQSKSQAFPKAIDKYRECFRSRLAGSYHPPSIQHAMDEISSLLII